MAHKIAEIKGLDETAQAKLAEAQLSTFEQFLEQHSAGAYRAREAAGGEQ